MTTPPSPFSDLAAEVATEVRLLRAIQAELAGHATERETSYRWADPAGLARTLPGLAEIGGPALAATMGTGQPLPHREQVPVLHRPGPQGVRDRRDRPQGPTHDQGRQPAAAHHPGPRRRQCPPRSTPSWPGSTTCRWSSAARTTSALCVVAAHLAERAWGHQPRHALRHLRHRRRPVTPDQAKAIIAEHWTVPEEVRRPRRHKKGKAPQQVLTGHVHGAQGATRRPSPSLVQS